MTGPTPGLASLTFSLPTGYTPQSERSSTLMCILYWSRTHQNQKPQVEIMFTDFDTAAQQKLIFRKRLCIINVGATYCKL